MPGHLLYKVRLVQEYFEKFWYFGDFGQLSFNQRMSDRYLVEAKTLFEYKQYLLATKALDKSNDYFRKIPGNLLQAKKNNKIIVDKKERVFNEREKHIEVLEELRDDLPPQFVWQDEYKDAQNLELEELINKSIVIRKKI